MLKDDPLTRGAMLALPITSSGGVEKLIPQNEKALRRSGREWHTHR